MKIVNGKLTIDGKKLGGGHVIEKLGAKKQGRYLGEKVLFAPPPP